MNIKQEIKEVEKKLLSNSSTDDMVPVYAVPWSRDTKLNVDEVHHDISVMARLLINVYAMWPFHKDDEKIKVLRLLNDIYNNVSDITAGQLFDNIKKIVLYMPDNHLMFSFCGERICHDSNRKITNVGNNVAGQDTVVTELYDGNIAVVGFSRMYKDDNTKQILLNFKDKIDASDALIIDLRGNGGGNAEYSNEFADYLCGICMENAKMLYMRNNQDSKKIGEYFNYANHNYQGDKDPVEIKPRQEKLTTPGYNKPIYILIDKFTGSGAEMFCLKMMHHPLVKFIGTNSRGMEVCGNKVYITLPKSHIVFSVGSVYRVLERDDFENNGITPDINCSDGQNAFNVALLDFKRQNTPVRKCSIER